MYYLVALFSVLFLLLCYLRPKYGLFLIFLFLPSYQIRFTIFKIPTTILEIMILILIIGFILKYFKNLKELKKRKQNSWFWAILALLTAATISIFFSPNLRQAVGLWRAYFIEPVLLLILFLNLIKTKKELNFVLNGLILSALFVSLWAIYQKFFGGGIYSLVTWGQPKLWRATGPFPQPNFLGLYLGPITILSLKQLSYQKNKFFNIFYFFVFFLSIYAIILARSRGAILGIFLSLIFLALSFRKTRKLTLLVILTILFFIFFNQSYQQIIKEKTINSFSGQIRLKIWSETLNMLKEKPIFGTGLAGYQKIMKKYHQPFLSEKLKIPLEIHPYPHNIFLAIWSNLGLFGLLSFLWILYLFFQNGFRKINKEKIFIMASMLSIIGHGLVDTPYFKNDLSILFWIIVGLMIWEKYTKSKDYENKIFGNIGSSSSPSKKLPLSNLSLKR